ncbi:MAG: helix-turn-helix domain-containing protein [Siculibacillus sp.]|nr:helix-turn-helix domain-containing protein [Siculibacillus sp.]
MNLLTQSEVAGLLRCSVSKIERLRRDGALPFLPGRPVLIELADVLAYVERMKATTRLRARGKRPTAREAETAAATRGRRAALKRALVARRV